MPVLLVPIGMGRRDGAVVRIAITRLSIPDYCRTEKSIATQLEEGKCFFAHKYPEMKYLAYFQAYTNTYAELEGLKRKYEEALQVDGVVGLVIGTRPDCMPEELLRYLEELNRHTFLMVEYGIESACDETLRAYQSRTYVRGYGRGCSAYRRLWHTDGRARHPRPSGRDT